ncbi:PBS lyase HEAT-like protein repeat protein [Gloeomargarita lithophora Alchichica-D10]|uniref:PBS lyase HEAT-like protein repeat protein n=1 Tax=Gloeomargarita lithophora Alchichica-D10 TaxID=1188229 RepID=A0A1J0ABI5_9CYAN|nr:HEAT repeat domain-containing protein [Gloeomargarita lithophora]APB33287.1 PBS lyase HEAT-like protein repeat protein [Gloeomargarita lithophora Alchichica-D10]
MTVAEAIAQLQAPDLSQRYYAAWWLGRFRVKVAVPILIQALQDESDRTELGGYPLRRNAARALGQIGDPQAIPGLLACLGVADFQLRSAAATALGLLGATQAIPDLVSLLMATEVPSALGTEELPQPYPAILLALGRLNAQVARPQIQSFLTHPLPRVRSVALCTMYLLTQDSDYVQQLLVLINRAETRLQRVMLADLGETGYLPVAAAMVQAQAEPSFKLMGLHRLLSQWLSTQPQPPDWAAAGTVFRLMDQLL